MSFDTSTLSAGQQATAYGAIPIGPLRRVLIDEGTWSDAETTAAIAALRNAASGERISLTDARAALALAEVLAA